MYNYCQIITSTLFIIDMSLVLCMIWLHEVHIEEIKMLKDNKDYKDEKEIK